MTRGRRRFLLIGLPVWISAGAWARAPEALTLSLEDYVQRAVTQGIQGRQNELTLKSAGYTRQIVFRQTDSPSLSANASAERTETRISGGLSTIDLNMGQFASSNGEQKTDVKSAGLTLNEPLPTGTVINVRGQTADTGVSGLGLSTDSHSPVVSATLTQPLYLFVKNSVARSRRQAELGFENAKDSFDATVLSLRAQAKSFYYAVMQGEESIQVEERKVASSKKLLEVTQALVEAGKTAAVETMRVKIQLQTDQRALENAVVARDKAVLSAKNFIYLSLDQTVQFSTQLEFKPFTLPLERLIDFADLHQPQLRSLRRARDLARLSYDASVEPARPSLSLTSGVNYSEASPEITHGWTLGANANWLLFDSFVTRDQANIAKIGILAADLNLAEGERTTRLNVQSAYLDVKNAERQINDFQSSREQARRNVEILRLRFRDGLERIIDVFDTETQMRDLDNQYLNLLVSYNQLKDNLSTLIGADVESLP